MDMAMEFSWLVAALIIVVVTYTVHNRINPKHSENLPPGSMGYPIIGEVFQFFSSHPAYSISPYMKERIQRYGTIFKTRLLGMPVIVSADAEFNHFVLQQEGRLFKMWYPEVSKIFAIGEDEARLHKYLRNSTLNLFGPESLKQSLLSEMDQSIAGTLDSWLALPSVEPKEAIYSMIFHWGAKRLLSLDTSKEEDDDQKDLAKHFMEFSHAIVSFLSLPRSLATNRFQGRKKVMKVVKRELEERLAHPRDEQRDLLDLLVQDMMTKEDTLMTKEVAMEIVFLLLFAVLHTMPMLTTFAIKFLSDHPDVLEELTKEHKRIVGLREDGRSWISWEEYKSMNYTAMVIKEVLRLVSPYVLRKSLDEINVKGYRIPKGWLVIVHLASVHMDPELFPDPTSFNPSRWEDHYDEAMSQRYGPDPSAYPIVDEQIWREVGGVNSRGHVHGTGHSIYIPDAASTSNFASQASHFDGASSSNARMENLERDVKDMKDTLSQLVSLLSSRQERRRRHQDPSDEDDDADD